jgi:hypothetical protein
MWSGPRSISTALMRAWENRPDTVVVDEPFYAYYLATTGIDHPMRDEVLRSQPTDYRVVVQELTHREVPRPIHYQKHMAQHLLPEIDRAFLDELDNALLIREPAKVIASYSDKRAQVAPEDLGYAQQLEIFEHVKQRRNKEPPVLLADDVVRAPRAALEALCRALAVPFDDRMLSWPAGRRPSDGVWAPHWYQSVEQSTGFLPERVRGPIELTDDERRVEAACRPLYDVLYAARLRVADG